MYRIHRICRASEHECVRACALAGLTPRCLFDRRASLLAQQYINEPATFSSAASESPDVGACVELLKKLHDEVDPAKFARRESRGDGYVFDVFHIAK